MRLCVRILWNIENGFACTGFLCYIRISPIISNIEEKFAIFHYIRLVFNSYDWFLSETTAYSSRSKHAPEGELNGPQSRTTGHSGVPQVQGRYTFERHGWRPYLRRLQAALWNPRRYPSNADWWGQAAKGLRQALGSGFKGSGVGWNGIEHSAKRIASMRQD